MGDLTHSLMISSEVKEALASARPVVALESTLITHGLPRPVNLETALGSEAAVRHAGALPTTIAIFDGVCHLGINHDALERLARDTTQSFVKASRRDLAWVSARRLNAATTVSATLWLARQAGIGVMATGGLGGVHRDASSSFDISMDLDELARANGALIVCSGVKSILDIPATLEHLETRGVAVVGYQTREFPAFTSRTSGLKLDAFVDSPQEAAALVQAHRALGLPGAIVLAQPVPEAVALDHALMEAALAKALANARAMGISGKAVTPFLLDQIREGTDGRSLVANTALIVSNAALAGTIASALAALQ